MAFEYVALVKDYAILPAPAKIVLLEIADRANVDHADTCWPSIQNIAQRTGYSRSTVIRRLNWLSEHGWIAKAKVIDHTGQQANKYRLNVARLRDLQEQAKPQVTDLSETSFEPFEEEKNRLKSRGVTETPPRVTQKPPRVRVPLSGGCHTATQTKNNHKKIMRDPALFDLFLKSPKSVGETFEQWVKKQNT